MNESRSFPEAESPLSECRPPLPHFLGVDSDRAEALPAPVPPSSPPQGRCWLLGGGDLAILIATPSPLAPV